MTEQCNTVFTWTCKKWCLPSLRRGSKCSERPCLGVILESSSRTDRVRVADSPLNAYNALLSPRRLFLTEICLPGQRTRGYASPARSATSSRMPRTFAHLSSRGHVKRSVKQTYSHEDERETSRIRTKVLGRHHLKVYNFSDQCRALLLASRRSPKTVLQRHEEVYSVAGI